MENTHNWFDSEELVNKGLVNLATKYILEEHDIEQAILSINFIPDLDTSCIM